MIWIAFEGPDGVGKTTQVGLLEAHFRKTQRDVVRYSQPHEWVQECRDPCFSFVTRRLLLHADNEIVMSLIHLVAKQEIVVITDRWHPMSEKVYATAGGSIEMGFSDSLGDAVDVVMGKLAKANPLPNLVINLTDKSSELEGRFKDKDDQSPDVFEKDKNFRNKIRAAYRVIEHHNYRVPIAIVDCENMSSETVHVKVLNVLAERNVI